LHRRLKVGLSIILKNVFNPHVYGEDKKCGVVFPPSISSSMQVLFCQRTRRKEVMDVNNVIDTLYAESPDVSELYNSAIFV
jgi:hypothetical protein